MQKIFELSYIMSYEEEPQQLFTNVTMSKTSNAEGSAEHLFQIDMVYGTLENGKNALPVAKVSHALVSDDHGTGGVGDDDGSTDLPLFLIYSESTLKGKLQGFGDIQLITRMGDDVVDLSTVMSEVTSSLNLSHKAFMHNALSMYEQLKAERPMKEFAEFLTEAELPDVITTFLTFYIASLHTDGDQASAFSDFIGRATAFCNKQENRVTMQVLD